MATSEDSQMSRTLISFTKSGSLEHSIKRQKNTQDSPPCDLISVITVAQHLDIDFLPITWQPALDILGHGGTSEISQAPVDIQVSFAFKRMVPRGTFASVTEETEILRVIITEIEILGHPLIRDHPNILSLAGLCWDVSIGGATGIWPVLVFTAADYGDLWKFMNRGAGAGLSWPERIEILLQIAVAVRDMHSHGIIHGDVKPGNVLVFNGDQSRFRVRVSDFGYSTWSSTDDELFHMPGSQPWVAPEWHHRFVTNFKGAKRMDICSFGKICSWLLLGNIEGQFAVSSHNDLPGCAIVEGISLHLTELAVQHRSYLQELFELSLAPDPLHRTEDIADLVSLLEKCKTRPSSETLQHSPPQNTAIVPDVHKGLEVPGGQIELAASIHQFYTAHFLLRDHIRACIESRIQTPQKETCDPCLIIQLAICYSIGFGVERSQIRATELLRQHELPEHLVLSQIQRISAVSIAPNFRTGIFSRVNKRGLARGIEFGNYYFMDGKTENDTISQYQREIRDVESSIGSNSLISQLLQHQLSSVLIYYGRREEAGNLQNRILEARLAVFGESHSLTLDIMADLAMTKRRLGKHKESEELGIQILTSTEKLLGPTHPDTISSLAQLASTLIVQGRYEDGITMLREALQKRQQVFGDKHPDVLHDMANLALAYQKIGKYVDAKVLESQVLHTSKIVLGIEHPDTLTSMSHLATTLSLLGEMKEAEELHMKALASQRSMLGNEHPDTLTIMTGLAITYQRQEKWTEAQTIETDVLEVTRRRLGETHPDTLDSKINLASSLFAQGRLQDSLKLELEVFPAAQSLYGLDHPDTLFAQIYLARTYQELGDLQKSEELLRPAILSIEELLGVEHSLYLSALDTLAKCLFGKDDFQEAEAVQVQILHMREQLFGKIHTLTLYSMENLAATYVAQEKWEQAEELLTIIVSRDTELREEDDEKSLSHIAELAAVFKQRGRYADAESLQKRVLVHRQKAKNDRSPALIEAMSELSSTYVYSDRGAEAVKLDLAICQLSRENVGEKHVDTIQWLTILGTTYGLIDKWDEAELCLTDAVRLHTEVQGLDHPSTIAAMKILANVLEGQGRLIEANNLRLNIPLEVLGILE